MSFQISRRQLLGGAVGLAALAARRRLMGEASAQSVPQPAVLVIFLTGGYNALFGSADSFASAGTFGVTGSNTLNVGNGLVVDASTFGALGNSSLQQMAQVGINHGHSSHDTAEAIAWTYNGQSAALQLASALGGTAAIRCAVMGSQFPQGPQGTVAGISMQQVTDLKPAINALGGGAANPLVPERVAAADALRTSKAMSGDALTASPTSLVSLQQAMDASVATLTAPAQAFSYSALASAYGVAATNTGVGNFTMQMLGAELMMLAGANVVTAVTGFNWDSHGDTDGSGVRRQMSALILPGLKTFLQRNVGATGRNITVAILGDFARSLPGSDHASVSSATVFGPRVKVGTTGRVTSSVGLPNAPDMAGFWSYLATLTGSPTNPFGPNPHSSIML